MSIDDKPLPPAPPPPPPPPDPKRLARAAVRLDDEGLLAQCELEFFTGSGPGGQHRNKSQTAVRLRHLPTGLVVAATERRSQMQNRGAALERLREKLTELGKVEKVRRKTKVPRAAKRRRLDTKKRVSDKKRDRRGTE